MSLILDALNRAERERSICQPVPTLETVHFVERPAWVACPRRLLLVVALLMFAALLLALGWRYAKVDGATGQVPLPRAKAALVPVRGADEKQSLAATREEVYRAPTEHSGAAGNGDKLGGAATRLDAVRGGTGSEASLPAPVAVSSSGEEALIGRLYQETSRSAARGEREVPEQSQPAIASQRATNESVEQAVAAHAVAERVTALSVAPDVPYITDLPMQLRRDIPSLNYSEHLPARPGGARVRLNGRLLGEGQRVAADLELLAIDEHGIVLQFRGVHFRLPALNRWVNF